MAVVLVLLLLLHLPRERCHCSLVCAERRRRVETRRLVCGDGAGALVTEDVIQMLGEHLQVENTKSACAKGGKRVRVRILHKYTCLLLRTTARATNIGNTCECKCASLTVCCACPASFRPTVVAPGAPSLGI